MTNPIEAALKAVFGKFRANFTARKEQDALESPPDQPLALPPGNAAQPPRRR
jgi:hypothetical protein